MTTDERLRQSVRHAEHEYKIHQMEQDRLKKESTWSWIKREVLFAEKLTNKELFILTLKYALAVPFLTVGTWLLFAVLYTLTGVR